MTKTERKLLHYTGKAISIYNMIQKNDRVLICLSGGKDSFTLAKLLRLLQQRSKNKFTLHVLAVDKGLPGWNKDAIELWLKENNFEFTILKTNIFNIIKTKKRPKDSYCVLCSRLRRGHIYTFAKKNGYNKIALGHHRDDLITSLLMSILYSGIISSMPPKLITNDKKLIVIRPMSYCQETDILQYANEQKFPLSTKGLCGAEDNSTREKVKQLIGSLAKTNPKIPANILHALSNVRISQLMDTKSWDFKNLEKLLQ
ncbi:MAG: tRNA 2-thiocytidine(32) synthetase TtcA [Gammaproteobacteria bacterium]|nr:tRNA 2-thiocytidine(32) synthetase TtcA [Gammaproteobacteria bacterium]